MEFLLGYKLTIVFLVILGYSCIIFEHISKIHKSAIALMLAVSCWAVYFLYSGTPLQEAMLSLEEHLAKMSQIVFFLIGAMVIVEMVDAHEGFNFIANHIRSNSRTKMLWIIGLSTFFLSAILDNLTTTIAMISIIRKLIKDKEDKWLLGSMVVIAANTGGAWTPIGDITTTMLWINGNITTFSVIKELFLPCLISLTVSLITYQLIFLRKKEKISPAKPISLKSNNNSVLMFCTGVGLLVFVPIFKSLTHLPPYMCMLISLSLLWIFTDLLYYNKPDKKHLKIPEIMKNIDIPSALFFAGILLSVSVLESSGVLKDLTIVVNAYLVDEKIIATSIGLLSAIVDNVPLVATSMSMYDLQAFPVDSSFWQMTAYCSGTGGSILIIGSAAGIALMGMEKVDFFWYLRKISLPALTGYFAGIISYLLINQLLSL